MLRFATFLSPTFPNIEALTDALVRVRYAGICGTDLHITNGYSARQDTAWSLGHEAMGIVEYIGNAVGEVSVGDYVVVPDGVHNATFQMTPVEMDCWEVLNYVRVPHADYNLIPIPNPDTLNATREIDYLFVGDIFATGWTALDFAGFKTGDTVAIFSAGPVGLLAAHSSMIRGASKVYVIDYVAERLQLAASIGAVPIDFTASDPVEQILALEPNGVRRSVDAVGYDAVNATLDIQTDIVIRNMVAVTGYNGGMGGVGVYDNLDGIGESRTGIDIPSSINFPISEFFFKGLSWGNGPVDVKMVAPELVRLIDEGVASPSFIVSSVVGIEEAPDAYQRFTRREETKVVIRV
ncbi:S-(hydroxymethyl)glutathione dehydrogenase [Colletotrichum liriopes]|uniref:S-(Hydroxymethyl)glutathione dehydrogenase n=1 Tax=Colletotrichum liriopes TaxID=708192 RepID=A0AA37GSI1_9PEZI|nr:S-(hydroxymethyl)glutathione dehydrogenase [Colletotrichum liriopes]